MNTKYDDLNSRFGGIARLYGVKSLYHLLQSHVMIIGLGGVGSWAAEALARSGVGTISLVDLDDVCVTNINRQLCATTDSIGKLKAHVIKERILAINPHATVNVHEDFFTEHSCEKILNGKIDFILDAIDSLNSKCLLIHEAKIRKIPLITAGGAAGKIDPTQVRIDDLAFAVNDKLLKSVRRILRREFEHERNRGSSLSSRKKMGILCVYSPEDQRYPKLDGSVCSIPDPESNLKLDCESGLGSTTHLTGTFGFFAASVIIKKLTDEVNHD